MERIPYLSLWLPGGNSSKSNKSNNTSSKEGERQKYNSVKRLEEVKKFLDQQFPEESIKTQNRNIKKGRDDVSVQLEEASERIVDLERKIQVFTGPHDNTEFRQLREDNVKISQDLDEFDLMGRSDLRDERRVLLTKLYTLTEDLAKKIHKIPNCPECLN